MTPTTPQQHPHIPLPVPLQLRRARDPLRLVLLDTPNQGPIDGAWWPRSRNLAVEIADLIDHFPAYSGRVGRILFSRSDWDRTLDGHGVPGGWPQFVNTSRGRIRVGSIPEDDTHLIRLVMSRHSLQRITIMVVPSDIGSTQGSRLMAQATDPDNRRTAALLVMQAMHNEPRPSSRASRGRDDLGAWDDDGGSQ